jgi:hypothetical protein
VSGSGRIRFDEPDDQPPVWVAFVTIAAAVLGVVIALYMFGLLT